MARKYKITAEQFEMIGHYKRMFEYDAKEISDLCSEEQDDVVYGFRLGQLHSHLRECFMGMMNLESAILETRSEDKEK